MRLIGRRIPSDQNSSADVSGHCAHVQLLNVSEYGEGCYGSHHLQEHPRHRHAEQLRRRRLSAKNIRHLANIEIPLGF